MASDATIGGKDYKKGYSYVVPMNQKNPRLIKAMFEKRTTFADSLFYDISAWTFPLAFNVDYAELSSMSNAGPEVVDFQRPTGGVDTKSSYAYVFEWHEYYTPKVLNAILEKGLRAKTAKTPFTLEGKPYDYGSIMIPVQNQKLDATELYNFLNDIAQESGVTINGVSTGLTEGIDLGSGDFEPLKKQKVAILVGDGTRSYDAGEIWHLFDTRYDIKITKIDTKYFNSVDLDSYTDLILPGTGWGGGTMLDEKGAEKIKEWVKNGGSVIGGGGTVGFIGTNGNSVICEGGSCTFN